MITGIQGIGVNTPNAAAVAEATIGFAIELHMLNGRIFFIGILSIIVAIGIVDKTLFSGVTINNDGDIPKEQVHIAPPHTRFPIIYTKPQAKKTSVSTEAFGLHVSFLLYFLSSFITTLLHKIHLNISYP